MNKIRITTLYEYENADEKLVPYETVVIGNTNSHGVSVSDVLNIHKERCASIEDQLLKNVK